MKYVLAGLALAIPTLSEGSHCVVRRQVVHTHVQAHHVAVAAFVPAIVAVPQAVYGVGYGQPAMDSQVVDKLSQILDRIDRRLERLEGKGDAQGDQPHMKVFNARCAQCHEKAVASKKGGGFILLENGQLPQSMNADDVMLIAREVAVGNMPKNGKLTREEFLAIQNWVGAVANQARAARAKEQQAPPPVPSGAKQ